MYVGTRCVFDDKTCAEKYFFDVLTCHYYLFDGLEFSHIQQYKYIIISNKHVRHVPI